MTHLMTDVTHYSDTPSVVKKEKEAVSDGLTKATAHSLSPPGYLALRTRAMQEAIEKSGASSS